MDLKVLICVLCFVAYSHAKSAYIRQDEANDIVKTFKVEDVKKAIENLQNVVDKLKDIKHNYLGHSTQEFTKMSQNMLQLLMKMPKDCIFKKPEQVQQIYMNGIRKFTLCQGFTDALNETETLVVIGEGIGLDIVKNLVLTAAEVNTCSQKGPFLVLPCLAEKMENISKQIEDIMTDITNFTTYASGAAVRIVADIASCYTHASKLTDDEMTLLLEEVNHCTNNNHS